jgi:hypothetical protein
VTLVATNFWSLAGALLVGMVLLIEVLVRRRLPVAFDGFRPAVSLGRRFPLLTGLTVLLWLGALASYLWSSLPSRETRSKGDWLLVDVSRSMLAEDAKGARLDVARQVAKEAIGALDGKAIGLVAFAGKARVVSPPTLDHRSLVKMVDDLTIDAAPPGGSDLVAALQLLQSVANGPTNAWLISDGGSMPDLPLPPPFRDDLVLSTIGVGDPKVAVPVPRAPGDRPIEENRQPVVSTLLEQPLRELAKAGHGKYIPAGAVDARTFVSSPPPMFPETRASEIRSVVLVLMVLGTAFLLSYRQGALCGS